MVKNYGNNSKTKIQNYGNMFPNELDLHCGIHIRSAPEEDHKLMQHQLYA